MNIHEYLKEEGFEMTGEYREARYGDYYLHYSNEGAALWECIPPSTTKRLILKKLRESFEFDGQTFVVPEGYSLVRVGVPKMSDVKAGYYITAFLGPAGDVVSKILESTVRCCEHGVFFIFKKREESK